MTASALVICAAFWAGLGSCVIGLVQHRRVRIRDLDQQHKSDLAVMLREIDSLRHRLAEGVGGVLPPPGPPPLPCEVVHETVPVTLMSGEQVSTWCITCQKSKHSQKWIEEAK